MVANDNELASAMECLKELLIVLFIYRSSFSGGVISGADPVSWSFSDGKSLKSKGFGNDRWGKALFGECDDCPPIVNCGIARINELREDPLEMNCETERLRLPRWKFTFAIYSDSISTRDFVVVSNLAIGVALNFAIAAAAVEGFFQLFVEWGNTWNPQKLNENKETGVTVNTNIK